MSQPSPIHKGSTNSLWAFAVYLRPYKASLALGVVFLFVASVLGQLTPFILGRAVNDLYGGVTWGKLIGYSSVILGVRCVSSLFWFLQMRTLSNMSRHVEYDMRRDLYAHLQRMPQSFFQSNRVGDLMARATNDLSAARMLAAPMLMYALQAFFIIAVVLALMLRISTRLTLTLFLTLPLVVLSVKYVGQQVHARAAQLQDLFARISARVQENLTGLRVVRAFGQEEAEVAAFKEVNWEYAEGNLRLVRTSALTRPLLLFFIGVSEIIILWYGGGLAIRGVFSLGELVEFSLYIERLVWPLISLGYAVNIYQRGRAGMKRVSALFAVEPAIADRAGVREQAPIRGRIEFRNLTFAYAEHSAPVLKDINLVVEEGQTVAFVGRTGSGKSTLMNLIPRVVEAPPRTVFIDGVDVRDYPLAQLRAAVGYAPQETFLFSDTLAENIAFGVESAERPRIEWAAEVTGLAEDVRRFPEGYDTLIGERGITLSGGQKQRAAIARAVLRQPRVLILDDALSSVDTYTEERILGRLRGVMRGRTSLIVSHRVSTVREADLICVLDEGRIAERGTHDELLALGGEYADLYKRQLLEEELRA